MASALATTFSGVPVASAQLISPEAVWTPNQGPDLRWRLHGGAGQTNTLVGTAGVDQAYHLTRTTTAADFPVNGLIATAGITPAMIAHNTTPFAAMNATSTPWVQLSYTDYQNVDGTWPMIMMFINGPASGAGQQIVVGTGYNQGFQNNSWKLENGTDITANPWGTAGIYSQNSAPTTHDDMGLYNELTHNNYSLQTPAFVTTTNTNQNATLDQADLGIPIADRVQRVDGANVRITVGKLADNTIEFTWAYNGVTYATWQNTFLVGTGAFDFYQIEIGQRYLDGSIGTPETIVFSNFKFGSDSSNIPEPASLALLSAGGVLMLVRRRKTI